jgi:hypothetical protein
MIIHGRQASSEVVGRFLQPIKNPAGKPCGVDVQGSRIKTQAFSMM